MALSDIKQTLILSCRPLTKVSFTTNINRPDGLMQFIIPPEGGADCWGILCECF